ncbi:MAG: ABC transporter permease subunit [Alphaproteobacteria bacterium]
MTRKNRALFFAQIKKFYEKQKTSFSKNLLIGVPFSWLLIFFFLPFLIVLKISFAEPLVDLPPYSELIEWGKNHAFHIHVNLKNYLILFQDDLYRQALGQSLTIASVSTFICLIMAYPMAYAMATAPEKKQRLLLLLVMLPFWTSFLLRVYAWIGLLGSQGVINELLLGLGIIDQPLPLLYNNFAVGIGMVYCYLPFMILPLYASLVKFDWSLLEAAKDLGARPSKIFFTILLPLTKVGMITGCLFVFIPSVGEFVIPELLGSSESLMLGKMIWTEFFTNRDWPVASAIAVCMLIFMILPLILLQQKTEDPAS